MKKFLIGIMVVAVFVAYILYEKGSQSVVVTNGVSTSTIENATTTQLKDGTYDGPVADAYYGPMQVQVIIKNGLISDMNFLQYPTHSGHTAEISASGLPILKQEAITAQSANVDIVSGATQTSDGFRESLNGALSLAR